MRFILALLAVLAAPLALASDQPGHGLMWNRTGLPLTLPLQVKTAPGADYVVTLTDAATGAEALKAYIEGGRFFRVLVPPGTFRVHFAYGTSWQSGQSAFTDQHTLVLKTPLTFEIRGLGRKAGHLVDITGLDLGKRSTTSAKVRDQVLCQVSRQQITSDCPLGTEPCDPPKNSKGYASPYDIPSRFEFSKHSYTRLCD